MTLVLTPQPSIRRSGFRPSVVKCRTTGRREINKASVFECLNMRLAVGFSGLAAVASQFKTRRWIAQALVECGPPDYSPRGITERFADKVTETFARDPVLQRLSPADRRLTILFTGFIRHSDGPAPVQLFVSNFEDLNGDGEVVDAAAPRFESWYGQTDAIADDWTYIERVGVSQQVTEVEVAPIRRLL